MARVKYYYNTETCNFERAKWDAPTIFRTVLSYTLVAGALAALFLTYLFYFYDNPATAKLRADRDAMKEKLVKFQSNLVVLEKKLDELHQQDENVYRAILKADPLTDQWNGGTGGSAEMELDNASLQITRQRLDRLESKINLQRRSYMSLLAQFKEKEDELQHTPSIRPVATKLISGFGYRMHPILGIHKLHTGLDFRAPEGTPVYATADGVIRHAGRGSNGYGIHIDIDHGYGYETKYAHLSKILVQEGQKVKRGDMIGLSGDTGLSKGPHLHYEVKKGGEKIDPIDYFYSDLTPEQFVEFKEQSQQDNESMD